MLLDRRSLHNRFKMSLHIQTPYIESVPLSNACGKQVYLKLENTQPSASFKLRGIGYMVERLQAEGKKKFICPSSGNAGYSLAWACRQLGLQAIIVAPESTPDSAIKSINSLGADVIVHGKIWDLSNSYAQELADSSPDNVYVTPYDDPLLWDGHATMIDEMVEQSPFKPDLIVCAVGGGGLISGITEGLIRNGWSDVPILGCGTYGANAFSETIKSGDAATDIGGVSSLVHCIAATHVTPHIVSRMNSVHYLSYLTDDVTAVESCERFMKDHRFIVDPACGVALSAVYTNDPILRDYNKIAVMVCGGAGVETSEYQMIKEYYNK